MTDGFEIQKNIKAAIYTFVIAALFLLLSFVWKWKLYDVIKPQEDEGIYVELNIPEEPEKPVEVGKSGGGGGGNPVEATGEKGTAYSPPQEGEDIPAKDIEEDPKETKTPAILKPDNPKPQAKKVNVNTTPIKTTPKPVTATPAPTRPKAVMGKTVEAGGRAGKRSSDGGSAVNRYRGSRGGEGGGGRSGQDGHRGGHG